MVEEDRAHQLVGRCPQDDDGQSPCGGPEGPGHRRVGERAGEGDDADPGLGRVGDGQVGVEVGCLLAEPAEGEQVDTGQLP